MHGPPLELAIKPGASPHAVYTPSTVPIHWEDKIKRDLDRDIDMGVLEKVDVNEPVTWCSRMVVTRKHNGEPRRTIDLQALNDASLRQTHPTMPPFQQVMSIPGGHWKSTTDAFNGYHSVSIRPEDRHLTTFLTPWGPDMCHGKKSRSKILKVPHQVYNSGSWVPKVPRQVYISGSWVPKVPCQVYISGSWVSRVPRPVYPSRSKVPKVPRQVYIPGSWVPKVP